MKNLLKLIRLIELTRCQPQTGYALSGMTKNELSDLASHHYLVTFIGWVLGRQLIRAGAKLNIERVLEYCLVHDLGELFGGDIAMPYAQINPKARRLAKAFEQENQKFLARYFGSDQRYFQDLTKEIMNAASDEALLAKCADYIEITEFKKTSQVFSRKDVQLARIKMRFILSKVSDPVAKKQLKKFVEQWLGDLTRQHRVLAF